MQMVHTSTDRSRLPLHVDTPQSGSGKPHKSIMGMEWRFRIATVAALVAGITFLHYHTHLSAAHYHILYEGLYFLPVILAAFWFGLRGGVATSLAITVLYLPFLFISWEGYSPGDLNRIKETVLYSVIAVMLGILRDSDRQRQKKLIAAESLAAVGQAVSCVAHDMKTPLIAIGGFTRQVQRHIARSDLKDDPTCRDKLNIIIRETARLEDMVRDMLDFSRPLELRRSKEDIGPVLEESLAVVHDLARQNGLTLEKHLCGTLKPVLIDTMRMKQVLINLLTNAIQASPPGETVAVRCTRRCSTVVIDVTDCGCGIPPEKRAEIFTPFVTTKRDGTGLGLPIARKFVEAHGGLLEVLDNPCKGTTFRITLPAR